MNKRNRPEAIRASGFSVIEIMFVMAIVGILMAICIPYYRQYCRDTRQNVCIANLKTLEGAVERERIQGKTVVDLDEICGSLGYVKGEPRCPEDRSSPYDISGVLPVCPNVAKYPEHRLKPR